MFLLMLCWATLKVTAKAIVDFFLKCKFKGIRIFFNLCDVRQRRPGEDWQLYMNDLFTNMPDGMHAWTFENKTGLFSDNEKMRDVFDFCQAKNILPVVCVGYQEETPHNWIGRAPGKDKWPFLEEFTRQLGIYLYQTYGFEKAVLEIWNEPTKLQALGFGYDKYIDMSIPMAKAWHSVSPNYEVWGFADDICRPSYYEKLLNHKEWVANHDAISVHIGVASKDSEWDDKLLQKLFDKISELKLTIKVAISEMSVNGIWPRFNQFLMRDAKGNPAGSKVIAAALILTIRKAIFGTATRIDDLGLTNGDTIKCTSEDKVDQLIAIDAQYYKPYILEEDDDMKLEEYYYKNKVTFSRDPKKAGIRFIQTVVGVTPDSIWGDATDEAVKLYQEQNHLIQDKIVGPLTFRSMMKNYPSAYTDLQYFVATGKW